MLTTRPELTPQLGGGNSSAKLLQLIADKELSRGLAPLSVAIGANDTIRRNVDGTLTLSSPPNAPVVLHDRHGDLARLLSTAGPLLEALHETTLETFLSEAVHAHYTREGFDGGATALNERGGNAFSYATIQQVLASDDPSQRGIECLASAAVHLWKSMGLIPPELDRREFEDRYTSIHGGRGGVRLGHEFDKSLRGFPSSNPVDRRVDATGTAEFANLLRHDDWAKLTGASRGRYVVRALADTNALLEHFARGGAGVRTSWDDNGHYFVISGARLEHGVLLINVDDSLRRLPVKSVVEYTPVLHTRFWTLER
ncbi:MAG: hypothetical protein JNM17_39105 [Archangium sp.]|nr:hypothetical protein [Archangium sp.]